MSQHDFTTFIANDKSGVLRIQGLVLYYLMHSKFVLMLILVHCKLSECHVRIT
jgi:hypothetical protein